MIKALFITLLLLDYGYKLLRVYLNSRQRKLPLPETVRNILTPEQHARQLAYEDDCQRLHLVRITLRFAVMLLLYATGLWSQLYGLFPVWSETAEYLTVIIYFLLITLLEAPFSYLRQFKIEEKYGMNRCSIKTFLGDWLRSLVLNIIIFSAISMGYYSTVFYTWTEMIHRISSIVLFGNLFAILFSNFFSTLGNKLTPMEAGPLRDKLAELFAKEGFRLKQIYIMDASRRTTRANAFCMGIGRLKRIVLYDNLIHNYSEEEIIGVFVHELAHYKHRDTLKLTLFSTVYWLFLCLLIGTILKLPAPFSASYGLLGVGSAFAVLTVLCTDVAGPVRLLLNALRNTLARPMEIRADAMVAEYGYGEGQISFLQNIARKDLADLNPHPLILALEDEHPPIHKRIEAIRNQMDATHSITP